MLIVCKLNPFSVDMCFIISAFPRPGHRPCMVTGPRMWYHFQLQSCIPGWSQKTVRVSAMSHSSLPQAIIVSVPPEHNLLWCNFLRTLLVRLSGNIESLALRFHPKCHSLPFLSTWWHLKYSEVASMTFINIHCWHWLLTCFFYFKSLYTSPFVNLWCWALFSALLEALRIPGK